MVGTQIMLILALGGWPRRRSEMSDLHEARDPGCEPQIDTAGWVYSAVAVAIIASAVIVAYKANDGIVANAPALSQVVAR